MINTRTGRLSATRDAVTSSRDAVVARRPTVVVLVVVVVVVGDVDNCSDDVTLYDAMKQPQFTTCCVLQC